MQQVEIAEQDENDRNMPMLVCPSELINCNPAVERKVVINFKKPHYSADIYYNPHTNVYNSGISTERPTNSN